MSDLYLNCLVSKNLKNNGSNLFSLRIYEIFNLMLKEPSIYTAVQIHIDWKAS